MRKNKEMTRALNCMNSSCNAAKREYESGDAKAMADWMDSVEFWLAVFNKEIRCQLYKVDEMGQEKTA